MPATMRVILICLVISCVAAAALAPLRNVAFEFCTTRTHGYPLPWRVDNCLCDGKGGQAIYPVLHAGVNAYLLLLCGIAVAWVVRFGRRKG